MKMNKVNEFINKIKNIEIQGATSIAYESSIFFVNYINGLKDKYGFVHRNSFFKYLELLYHQLISVRPTEPLLKNCLNYILKDYFNLKNINKSNITYNDFNFLITKINDNFSFIKNYFDHSKKKIKKYGSLKIQNGFSVFTHCHSSLVVDVLKEAKKQNKNFVVNNTETRPLFQGRKTAKELSALKIPVFHHVDSAARIAIKNSDIMLLGCDAITSELYFANKIGSEMFAMIADKYDIPVYIVTFGLKYDYITKQGFKELLENRKPSEVWDIKSKYIKINNPAFEFIKKDLITGIISELGIFSPDVFLEELMITYPWLRG